MRSTPANPNDPMYDSVPKARTEDNITDRVLDDIVSKHNGETNASAHSSSNDVVETVLGGFEAVGEVLVGILEGL